MASSTCESPLRRFAAKDLPNKTNSPVDVNRLKTLLRKNVAADDGKAASSPKKVATPRTEIKVKRGATVKLCSSCENHNKDVSVDTKQRKATQGDAEAPKKKRVTRKDATPAESQGQASNSVDAASAVEKKTAAKKPRETKKKAVTQDEKLNVPSTSGTVQSEPEASALTDGGAQPQAESRPKRQRKNVDKTSQQDEANSSTGKVTESKSKKKDEVGSSAVKANEPKRKKKDEDDSSTGKVTESKSKKKDEVDSSAVKANEPKRKKKDEADSSTGKGAQPKSTKKEIIKVKVPRPKNTNKAPPEDNTTTPFENMNVTDMVNSTLKGEESAIKDATDNVDSSAKSKPTRAGNNRKVNFEESVTSDSASNDLAGPSVVKETRLRSKSKTRDTTKTKIPRPKKTDKHLPEDNETVPFEKMNVTDLINSTQLGEEKGKNSSTGAVPKAKQPSKGRMVTFDKSGTPDNSLADEPADNSAESLAVNQTAPKSKSKASKPQAPRPKKTAKKSPEDNETAPFDNMDVTDLVNSTQIGEESVEPSVGSRNKKSTKTSKAGKNNSTLTQKNDTHDSGLMGDSEDMFKDDSLTDMQKKMQAMNFDISFSNGNHEKLPEENAGTSAGEKINLSASTTISHNGTIDINPIDLNIVDNSAAHQSNIHNDETFCNQDLANTTVDNMLADANVTMRTRSARRKANASKNVSSDGISSFTENDTHNNSTRKAFNKSDKNLQQPSTADIERLMQVKPEPPHHGNGSLSQQKSNDQPSTSIEKPQQQVPKSTGTKPKDAKKKKLPAETSEASKEPTEKKFKKKSTKNPATESSQKEAESSKKKSKLRKNDETLCEKHKNCKRSDEKVSHRLAHDKKANKQLKNDMKVAKAMEAMSKHFSRISIGTTIGTINELHIGKLPSESDSSDECSTDCSCEDYSDESNSSGDHCKCWKCLMDQSDSSGSESSDESDSSESGSSEESSSSSSSPKKIRRHAAKKCSAKGSKSAKPTYKEKLSKFCSQYDLRCNSNGYSLRSKDH